MAEHEEFMRRCLELGAMGAGRVAPNPMVGSLLVAQGRIVAEGFHERCGGPHAEVNAINALVDRSLLKCCTLYVNLEPCSHFGKTPPCADLIIRAGIPRVVIGSKDINHEAAGGTEKLRAAGIEVTVGVLENESHALNRRFLTFHSQQRPYIVLKWAQTRDGLIARADRRMQWITNQACRRLVHTWRAEESSILVGTNTALDDNPRLTVRECQGENPLRLVLDRSLRLPNDLCLFDESVETWVFCAEDRPSRKNLRFMRLDFSKDILPQIMAVLYQEKILSLFVEGGAVLLQSLIDAGLWDEARVFTGPLEFGEGVAAPRLEGSPDLTTEIEGSELRVFTNR